MSKQTTNPFDEQAVTPQEEESVPEIITHEASSVLLIPGKLAIAGILMKPNFTVALSESNKRYLDQFELITDYVEAGPELWEKYGISEEKRGTVMLLKNVDLLPLDFVVSGYDKGGSNKLLPAPEIICALKEGTNISREEAIKILADWFYDNDYCVDCYDEMMACENIQDAFEMIDITPEDVKYAEDINPDDEEDMLECASLHRLARQYVDDLKIVSNIIYSLLAKRYEESGIILVDTRIAFGFDEECNVTLAGEVGTPDESTMASKMLFERNGELVDMIQAPVLEYFKNAENVDKDAEVPSYVLDEVSDTCMYLAEALCDDLSFDMYL